MRRWLRTAWVSVLVLGVCPAQDSASTIRGTVSDASGARIAGARVVATRAGAADLRVVQTDAAGEFALPLLPPGEYSVRAEAAGMRGEVRQGVVAAVGGAVELHFVLAVRGAQETVTVTDEGPLVETQPGGVSSVIGAQEIAELPLNGRRFQDLVLQTPGVTQDPRGLTSSWNGDLAFGGVRGYHTAYFVDGLDNNNGFFAQARGRYRAPYQFSTETVQEFRVTANTYSAELGRSSGAVVNIVTKSGTNQLHGSLFYFFRGSEFSARHPFVPEKPFERQHQFGATLSGRVARDRAYWFLGYDQHVFRVPTNVRFLDGSVVLTPTARDYEPSDRNLVFGTAAQLSAEVAGDFDAELLGSASLAKLDYTLSPRHALTARVSVSRYYGANNVFFDPASPVTYHGISENGTENVATESYSATLTSALSMRFTSRLRAQFSRDLQGSSANSDDVRVRIYDVIEGFGRSSILPRATAERRLHLVETLNYEGRRHSLKLGADVLLTRAENFFPLLFGGEYIFGEIRVNPFTFEPQPYGLRLTPLRAYAHAVPRYFLQNFGASTTRPDANDFALFAQDTIRLRGNLAVTLGLRWDLQTFRDDRLEENPLWPGSGRVPSDWNNFSPRVAFAWSLGERRPLVVRGGYGVFFTRVPQMYTSAVELENGLRRWHLFLDNSRWWDRRVFPAYPGPLASCTSATQRCDVPPGLAEYLETEIAAFAPDFQTPYVRQGSVTAEREFYDGFAVAVSYLYVRGAHLLRSRDINLPEPEKLRYPVFDPDDDAVTGYYTVESFVGWQLFPSVDCPFPPCLRPLERPVPQVGSIRQFESAVTSEYHGVTVSARQRMRRGLFFRVAYTWASAEDDGQDALLVAAPPLVQNTWNPRAEKGRSSTDQRHRFAASWIWAPNPFDRERPLLKRLLNDWTVAGTITFGSGRPVNARILGDANRDANSTNDRLPGARRNAFYGPEYFTADLRLSRRLHVGGRFTLDALVESFNVLNRANTRVTITDDGFQNAAGEFVPMDRVVEGRHYPAYFRVSSGFLQPTDAYAPRQIQFGLKLRW